LQIATFLRQLQKLKQANNLINLDFIAFGLPQYPKKQGLAKYRHPTYIDFFEQLVNSSFVDSFSLYTLELFEGSLRYKYLQQQKIQISQEDILEEFEQIKAILTH